MSSSQAVKCFVRERRTARGWSQQDLAQRAGIARASVSAIEMERLVPSAAAALALAAALDCRVEDLFRLSDAPSNEPSWAWPHIGAVARYWQADVNGRPLLYPVEPTYVGALAHDGVFDGRSLVSRIETPPSTLVMACCDPAVGLLAGELSRSAGIRLLPLVRSSRDALKLLQEGLVHAAGLHLGPTGKHANAAAIRELLGAEYRLVHVAVWEEGIVTPGDRQFSSLGAITRSRLRWVGREPGSGARQCLDEVLGSRAAPRHLARDHRGVAEAVRAGWADAGVCLRLVGEEAALNFLPVRREAYDLCFPESLSDDPRIRALLAAIKSSRYRQQINDLPGYRASGSGD